MSSLPFRLVVSGVAVALHLTGSDAAAMQQTLSQRLEIETPAARPAHLTVEAVPLTEALVELSRSSGVVVGFSPTLVTAQAAVVDCNCQDVTVGEALVEMLAGLDVGFATVHGQIVVFPRTDGPRANGAMIRQPEDVGVAHWIRDLPIQPSRIQPAPVIRSQEAVTAGVVVAAVSLQPVSGADVVVVGTGRRTVTNAEGRFRFDDLEGPEVDLQVMMLGYRTRVQTVRVGSTDARIVLSEEPIALSEIIVTGTAGETEKRAIANSVAEVRVSDVADVAATESLGQLLQGRAAGVVINSPTGFASGPARLLIRGRSSLGLSIAPLIYIDGVRVDNTQSGGSQAPATRLNDIDPAQIESVEIIKGPAAATLYGTEASNGVIQILTKKGRAGSTRIEATVRQGVAYIADPEGRWPVNYYTNDAGETVAFNIIQSENRRGTPIFSNGHLQGYGLNISGGSDDVQYFTSLQYDDNRGAFEADWYERFSGRLNVTTSPREDLTFEGRFGMSMTRSEYPDYHFTFSALISNPAGRDSPTRGFFSVPPEVVFRHHSVTQNNDQFTGGVEARHAPFDWLTQRLGVGLNVSLQEDVDLFRRMPPEDGQFFFGSIPLGQKSYSQNNSLQTTVDYNATAEAPLSETVLSSSSIGFQFFRKYRKILSARGNEFPAPDVTAIGGAGRTTGFENQVEDISIGGFIQQRLSWNDRFFLTAAIRGDDHSAFGRDYEFVPYPKAGLSWVVSEEAWWNLEWMDQLRLRAAWGRSGQQPSAFAAVQTFRPTTAFGSQPAVTPSSFGNAALEPEKSEEIEIGIDGSAFGGRLALEATYYDQVTRDAILNRRVAPSTGFPGAQFVNAGKVENRGFEVALNAGVVDREGFALDLGLNLSYNDNEVRSLNLPDTEYLQFGFGAVTRFQPGFPAYAIFGRHIHSADVGPDGLPINIMCDGGVPREPGGDPLLPGGEPIDCASAPLLFAGQVDPKFQGSLNGGLSLLDRRLRLSAMVDFKTGHKNRGVFICSIMGCEEEFFPERFTPERVAAVTLGLPDAAEQWQDVSFAKLREVAVSYELPESWIAPFGMSRARVAIAGRNLAQWTTSEYQGMDPENNSVYLETTPFGGFDQDIPQLRSFVTRFNFSF